MKKSYEWNECSLEEEERDYERNKKRKEQKERGREDNRKRGRIGGGPAAAADAGRNY